jgi:hypothetical protein
MFLMFTGTTIAILTITIGFGWMWDRVAQWRLSRQRSCSQSLWFIRFKWTMIQLYQKLMHRWHHR